MPIRVVRFTDVTAERLAGLKQRLEENEGPPDGVVSTGVQFLHDADQGTMVVIQHFETADDMRTSEQALEAMDASETPGTRASVDRCEVFAELSS